MLWIKIALKQKCSLFASYLEQNVDEILETKIAIKSDDKNLMRMSPPPLLPSRPPSTPDSKCICDICQSEFFTIIEIEAHMQSHIPMKKRKKKTKKLYNCNLCDKSFCNENRLQKHLRELHREPVHAKAHGIIKCKQCGKTFDQQNEFTQHVNEHKIQNPFICNVCGKVFASNKSLVAHLNSHTKEKMHPCRICDKLFLTTSTLRRHLNIHLKTFTCQLCGKSFGTNSNLIKHTTNHTDEKQFQCKFCNKTFSCRRNLNEHFKSHAAEISNYFNVI